MSKRNIILFILLLASINYPQTVFTPLNSDIYRFLDNMAIKNVISYNDEVKPLSRKKIGVLLIEISKHQSSLNLVEKNELSWYLEDYAVEVGNIKNEKWYLYSYTDSLFKLRVSPIAGYEISKYGTQSGHRRWWGFNFWGYYSDYFAGSFEYRDNGEFGGNVDFKKEFSPKTGYNISARPKDGVEYSDVKGSISLDWNWGSISLIKDYLAWGHGKFGQVILSSKAPSFPHIRLMLQPVEWLRFYYIHGWLNSLVLDSSHAFYNNISSGQPYLREKYIDKYIVANMLSITPFKGWDFSIGNSYVYGGLPRLEMFIPFLYYKVMDHNTGRQGVDDGNGQIFFDLKAIHPKKFKFYGTLLIDVLEIRQILKGNWWTSWFAYTLGGKRTDLLIDNLSVVIEYTKINPWVYENRDEVSTYKHLNYTLGHWIGQNADEFSLQFDYQPLNKLNITLLANVVRKGGLDSLKYAYDNKTKLHFLYSPRRNETSLNLKIKYEYLHDLFIEGYIAYSNISDEDKTRTQGWMLGKKSSFGVSLQLGL